VVNHPQAVSKLVARPHSTTELAAPGAVEPVERDEPLVVRHLRCRVSGECHGLRLVHAHTRSAPDTHGCESGSVDSGLASVTAKA
jgi:hypothetical protein